MANKMRGVQVILARGEGIYREGVADHEGILPGSLVQMKQANTTEIAPTERGGYKSLPGLNKDGNPKIELRTHIVGVPLVAREIEIFGKGVGLSPKGAPGDASTTPEVSDYEDVEYKDEEQVMCVIPERGSEAWVRLVPPTQGEWPTADIAAGAPLRIVAGAADASTTGSGVGLLRYLEPFAGNVAGPIFGHIMHNVNQGAVVATGVGNFANTAAGRLARLRAAPLVLVSFA